MADSGREHGLSPQRAARAVQQQQDGSQEDPYQIFNDMAVAGLRFIFGAVRGVVSTPARAGLNRPIMHGTERAIRAMDVTGHTTEETAAPRPQPREPQAPPWPMAGQAAEPWKVERWGESWPDYWWRDEQAWTEPAPEEKEERKKEKMEEVQEEKKATKGKRKPKK
eukprot:TRINITY_DN27072_c0_g1_i1.p2 TRINITY_DN27072_c0_g1~~TRINITY_DN27072_c0_g1_i1.p2  ORF type:complete len:166 (+),score=29.61 TRINITY_DN27072_c0_g1_i1:79-576(+)